MEDDGKTYPTLPANYITIVDLQKRWMKQQQQQQQQEEEKKKQNNKKKEESIHSSIYSFSNKDEEDNHANQNSQFQKPNRSKFDNGNLNPVIRRPIHRNFHGKKRLEDEKIAKKVSNNPISEASENNADVTKVVIDDQVKQMDDRKVEHEKDAKKMKKKKNKKNRRIQKQNHPMMKSNECCEVEERENQGKAETDKDDQTVEKKDNQETNADKTAEIELKLKEVFVSSRKQCENNGRSRAAIKWRKLESGTKIWEVKKVKEIPAIHVVERESKGDERLDVDINSKLAHVMHEPEPEPEPEPVKEVYKYYRRVERQKHWESNRENSPRITREFDEERENGGKSTAVVEGYRGTSRGYSGVDRRRMGWSWRRNEGGLVWVKKTDVKS